MSIDRKTVAAAALICAGFVLAYYNVLGKLVHDWANDDNYSHGFLIVPLAALLRLGAAGQAGRRSRSSPA